MNLIYRLQGLAMAGAILHIGAHPDDEDIGMLAYMSHKIGVRVVYWSATRGEGGQNRLNGYKGEALGIYRTWESLAARAVDGGEALFGPFIDFGYSKNGEETLSKWGRRDLIREIVRAIRLVQPQIVISRWRGDASDGHGHHKAVGAVIEEAFVAAGDPEQFPNLGTNQGGQALVAWQPRKLYYSTGGDWQPGEDGEFGQLIPRFEQEGYIRLNSGEFDPIAGLSYQEQAWRSLNSHKSQGMGFIPTRGDYYYYYSLGKSLVPLPQKEQTFYDALDPSLTGLVDYPGNGSAWLRKQLEFAKGKANAALEAWRPYDSIKAGLLLLEALSLLRWICDGLSHEKLDDISRQALCLYLARKISDFEEVAALCLGLQLECFTNDAQITPGQHFRLSGYLWNHQELDLQNPQFSLRLPDGWQSSPEALPRKPFETSVIYNVDSSEEADLSCPYWLIEEHNPYRYTWPVGGSSSQPYDCPLVGLECEVTIGAHQLRLRTAAVLQEGFAGGFRELAMSVIPPISLHPRTNCVLLPVQSVAQALQLRVLARSNMEYADTTGSLKLEVPKGWQVEPKEIFLSLGKVGDAKTVDFTVTIPQNTAQGLYDLQYVVHCGNRDYRLILEPVRLAAPGLCRLPDDTNCVDQKFMTTPAKVKLHLIDVEFIPGLSYAYVKGAEEEVPESLLNFGITFHLIADEEMGYINLNQFDAIVIGPNAYLIRDQLRKNKNRFLSYTEQGGTLIVQYQGYGYQGQGFTPYPFKYNQPHDRVTDERAPVTILNPGHRLVSQPNLMIETDFSGWVHDRGMYFFGEWDKRYQPLLACSDFGEALKAGGLLLASYGQGDYLYTGYSFHRQLPAGVPGAFRLFANMLALPMYRILERVDILKKLILFSFLDQHQLQHIARIMSERWQEDGVYLCQHGDEADEMYVIVQGQVEILKKFGKREQVIYLTKPGEIVGEMGVLGNTPRAAAMRTRGETRLLVIKAEQFRSLMNQHPETSQRVIQVLVQKLAAAGGELSSIGD